MIKLNVFLTLFLSVSSIFAQQTISDAGSENTDIKSIETYQKIDKKTDSEGKPSVESPKLSFLTTSSKNDSEKSSSEKIFAKTDETNIEEKTVETDKKDSQINPKTDDDDKKKQPRKIAKWQINENAREYGIEVGYAPNIATWWSPNKPWDISGHKLFLTSLRFGKNLGTRGPVTFSYALEFIPLSIAIGNQTENKAYRTDKTVPPTFRRNNYGFAFNPTSFKFIFLPKLRLRPFAFAGLGISYHIKPVPIESGTKWNMQFDFGFGGQYMIAKDKSIQFGYRYYHLSNIYLSNYNPGYNSNVIFVGYSLWKDKK